MEIFRKLLKQEKGSITMTVLAAMIFMTTVLIVSYLSISNQSSNQKNKIQQISKQYSVTNTDLEQKYNKVYREYVYHLNVENGLGDVDFDEEISIDDIEIISDYLSENIDLTAEEKARADFNKDGEVTGEDVTLIQNYINRTAND